LNLRLEYYTTLPPLGGVYARLMIKREEWTVCGVVQLRPAEWTALRSFLAAHAPEVEVINIERVSATSS